MKKYILLVIMGLFSYGIVFSMASRNVSGPSVEGYKAKLINADQEIIRLIAERKGIRNKLLKYEKKHDLPAYDPFKDKSIAKIRTSFAIQYDVSPSLVDNIFKTLNTTNLQTADQSF